MSEQTKSEPWDSTTKDRKSSRSPHSYRQRQADLAKASPQVIPDEKGIHHDVARKRQWKEQSSSGESGTEADDEHGTFLKALPPASLRPSKGLKDAAGIQSGAISPLLTPSILDDDHRRQQLGNPLASRGRFLGLALVEKQFQQTHEKFEAKRRAELLRRLVETLLLAGIGLVTVQPFRSSNRQRLRIEQQVAFLLTVLCLYTFYPLRLVCRRRNKQARGIALLPWIRISASFEPAPFLYPVFLPMFVSIATSTDMENLVVNLSLCIASIPRAIIPFSNRAPYDRSLQWMLTLAPFILHNYQILREWNSPSFIKNTSTDVDFEALSLLFPFHQCLLSALHYITTTSLLPAELQLTSTALINLAFLSVSPQSLILKAILWIGGILTFAATWRVLKWEVALARIPFWRFRKSKTRSRRNHILGSAFSDLFKGRLYQIASTSSDEDEPMSNGSESHKTMMTHGPPISSSTSRTPGTDRTIDERFNYTVSNESLACGNTKAHRRNTMPPRLELPKDLARDLISPFSIPQNSLSRSFLRLSQPQGTLIRWSIAIYTYITVILTIFVPVRIYIVRYALHAYDPFGWALGYLFGQQPILHHLVADLGLATWIPLGAPHHGQFKAFTEPTFDHFMEISRNPSPNTRLYICAWCLLVLVLGIASVLSLSIAVEVDTRRKVFHGMMVAMFLPTIFIDPCFVSLAFSIILPIFLLLDLFRASQLPPLAKPLTRFLAPYVDGRDHRGPVIVSHIFLLVGCAIPLWLSLSAIGRTGTGAWAGWDVPTRDLSMVSGVICVGMGDAAASLIGRRFGRRRWWWSGGKSFEGSFAFLAAVVIGLCTARVWLRCGGWPGDSGDSWTLTILKASLAGAGASLTEAVLTGGNDNVIVPVILWLLVKGLRI